MSIKQALLIELEREKDNTLRVINNLVENKFDYKPHVKSMTLGQLANHIVELHNWIHIALTSDSFDLHTDYKPYTNNGTSVVIYVSELWLVGSNEDHIKWCNTVGNEMDKIYSKHMNKTHGNVYTHIYLNNNNGTVSELAWYKPVGNVELYYKH